MRKSLWIIVAVVILVLIGGYAYFNGLGKTTSPLVKTGTPEVKKDIFTSIKDAMSKSLSLKCEYQNDQGKTTAYIKGAMVRAISQTSGSNSKTVNIILKENKMWLWTDGEKEGMVFDVSEKPTADQQANKDKIFEDLEKFKNNCSSAVVADSFFVPPAEVNFKNLSNFQQELMKNLNITGVPTVTTGN